MFARKMTVRPVAMRSSGTIVTALCCQFPCSTP
jgi:hypothetical protein